MYLGLGDHPTFEQTLKVIKGIVRSKCTGTADVLLVSRKIFVRIRIIAEFSSLGDYKVSRSLKWHGGKSLKRPFVAIHIRIDNSIATLHLAV